MYICPDPDPESPKPDPIPKGQVRFLFAKIVYIFLSRLASPKLLNTTAIYYMINNRPV